MVSRGVGRAVVMPQLRAGDRIYPHSGPHTAQTPQVEGEVKYAIRAEKRLFLLSSSAGNFLLL